MKNKICFVGFCTFVICLSHSSVFSQTVKQVKQIRANVKAINLSLSKYTKISKDVENISAEGATATYYSSKTGLKKIHAEIFGESGRSITALYYKAGKLIFAYEKSSEYNVPIGATGSPKVVNIREERTYFVDGKLIKVLVSASITKPNEQWEKVKKNMLEWNKIFQNALK